MGYEYQIFSLWSCSQDFFHPTVCSVGRILLGGLEVIFEKTTKLCWLQPQTHGLHKPKQILLATAASGGSVRSPWFWKNPRISTGRVGLQKEACIITHYFINRMILTQLNCPLLITESHMNFHLEKPQCWYKQRQIGCTVTICGYIYEMSGHLWRNSIPITTWAWGLRWCPEVYVHVEGNKKIKIAL